MQPVLPEAAAWTNITEAQIAEIGFDGLPADDGIVAALAPPTLESAAQHGIRAKLAPGRRESSTTPDRASATWSPWPRWPIFAPIPGRRRSAGWCFAKSAAGLNPPWRASALAWIILSPEDGQALTKAPELGLFRHPPERLVRQRSVIYAEKYLGRLARQDSGMIGGWNPASFTHGVEAPVSCRYSMRRVDASDRVRCCSH